MTGAAVQRGELSLEEGCGVRSGNRTKCGCLKQQEDQEGGWDGGAREAGGEQESGKGVSSQGESTGTNAAQGSSETRPAKCPQRLAARRAWMTLSRMVSVERRGQRADCSGSPGEVTFEPGREWRVRNWSASSEPLIDCEEKPEGSSWRRKAGQRRAPRRGEAPAGPWAAMRREC